MRLLILTVSALLAATSSAAPTAAPSVERPRALNPLDSQRADNCPRTTSHYAGKGSMYPGDRIAPKKLNELPPAVGYMAVYRTVNGCEVPMTIIEYRTGRRP